MITVIAKIKNRFTLERSFIQGKRYHAITGKSIGIAADDGASFVVRSAQLSSRSCRAVLLRAGRSLREVFLGRATVCGSNVGGFSRSRRHAPR